MCHNVMSQKLMLYYVVYQGAFVYNFNAVCEFGADDGNIHKKNILFQGTGMLRISAYLILCGWMSICCYSN